jgi:flagella basal body P-ring formation protein FlgA
VDNHPALIACALALAGASAQAQLEAPQSDAAQALVMQAAHSALGAQRSGARLEVQIGAPDPRLRLAPCRRVEPYLPAGHRVLGRTRVGLRCVEGTVAWNISLPVTVSLFAPGVVVRDALPAGTRLTAEHLTLAEIDWGVVSGAQSDVQSWVGRELSRPMAAGTPLQSTDLRQRQWFAAGETVQIVARGAGFAVATEGEALSHGVEGQPVRVRTSLGRLLSGRATADRTVEVAL